MNTCWRSVLARSFQQNARLRRQTNAIADLLSSSSASKRSCRPRSFATTLPRWRTPVDTFPSITKQSPTPNDDPILTPRQGNIPTPVGGSDIQAWVDALEVALPARLRDNPSKKPYTNRTADGQTLEYFLLNAYRTNGQKFELLTHLALEQGRWEAVIWIINQLIEQGDIHERAISSPSSSPVLRWQSQKSLHNLTATSFSAEELSLELHAPSLGAFVDFSPRMPDHGWTYHKAALGQVWRALGSMILEAAGPDESTAASIMPYVLEIIAILHHHNIIPESIYRSAPSAGPFALQQPPTLHVLSSHILTSISDAAWRAQESSNAIRSKTTGAQYDFLGREMPGTAYRSHIPQLGAEVWLELVLWSCLHGGWIEEGASILCDTEVQSQSSSWSLISWTAELHSQNKESPGTANSLAHMVGWLTGNDKASERMKVEKTLSSELIVAYVDAMLNIIRLGVGQRGLAASQVFAHISRFKEMLDNHNMGLGTMSWDAVVVRFLESEGLNTEKNPLLLRNILTLSQPFGRELKLINTPPSAVDAQDNAYMFDPSAAVLGLQHRVIRTYVGHGDAYGALKAFEQLQDFTDLNKKRSMEEFFANLARTSTYSDDLIPSSSRSGRPAFPGFTSNVSELAAKYPNFHPQIPSSVLARLLDLITDAEAFEFGQWLLYSEDADGAVIPRTSFADPLLGPALVRYAAVTRNSALLRRVIQIQSAQTGQQGPYTLNERVLRSFLDSQIALRRWDSAENILTQTGDRPERVWTTTTFAVLARELLRLERDGIGTAEHSISGELRRAQILFRRLAQGYYGKPRGGWHWANLHINTVLGFLSSLSTDWAQFCASLRTTTSPHPLLLPDTSFHKLLEGVVYAYGSFAGRETWLRWCEPLKPPQPSRSYRSRIDDLGIPKIDALRSDRGRGYQLEDSSVIVDSYDGDAAPFVLYGRVQPNFNSVRAIIRGAAAEREQMSVEEAKKSRDTYDALVQWSTETLRSMGMDGDDIVRELEPLKLQ